MSELQRIEIQGIRSFRADPDNIDSQSIEFDGPVTLITGENGTGKTTIIESLKYATMGDCTKEMIADPKIWEQSRVDAKVALKFKSNDGNNYTIIRSASLSNSKQRRQGMAYSSGECQIEIQYPDNKIKKIDISSTESKTQVPLYLGVSPSILENVIFCHQQDSCWPIDYNTRALKERFDEIFGAERYDKATKALKEVLKNLKSKKTEYEKDTAVQNTKQEALLTYERNIAKSRKAIIKLDKEMQEKEILFQDIDFKMNEYENKKSSIDNINSKISGIEGQCKSEKKYLDSILEKIKKSGELQHKESCHSSLENIEGEIRSKEEMIDMHNNFVKNNMQKHKEAEMMYNRFKEEYEKLSATLDTAESQRKFYQLKLDDFQKSYQSDDLDAILAQKKEEQAEADELKESMKVKQRSILEQKDEEIRKQEASFSKENSELMIFESRLESSQKELKKLGSIDTSKVDDTKQKLEECEKERNAIIGSGRNADTINNEIKTKEKEQNTLDEEYNKLLGVKKSCEDQANEWNKLKNAKDKLAQAKAKREKHLSDIKGVLNDSSIDCENAEEKFKAALADATDKRKSLLKKQTDLNNKLSRTSSALERVKSGFEQREKEANEAKKKIDAIIPPEDGDSYESELEITQQLLNKESDKLSRYTNSTDVYKNFKEDAAKCENGCHSCPLCLRKFNSDEEYNQFVKERLEEFISSLPNKIKRCEKSKRMYEERLSQLRSIQSDVDTYEKSKPLQIKAKEEIESLSQQQQEFEETLNQVNKDVQIAEERLRELQDLKSSVDFLKQANKERDSAKKEKMRASTHINKELPPLEKVQMDMNELDKKKSQIFTELKDLLLEQNQYSEKINRLNSRFTNLQKDYESQREKYSKKQELDSTISILHQNISEKKAEVKQLKSQLDELRHRRQQIVKDNDNQFSEQNERANKAKQELQRCQDLVNEIKMAKTNLDEVDSGDMSNKRDEFKKLVEAKEKEVKEALGLIETHRTIRDADQAKMPALKDQFENMKLQCEYYERYDSYDALKTEIRNLEGEKRLKLGSLANEDTNNLQVQHKKIHEELVTVRTEKKKEEEALKLAIEESRGYESARKALSEATISLKSVEMCITDVERYIKALDETLLEYHAQKMQEVNDTIQQLWENTYYGQDIDSISIKCEGGKTSNAAYNYRVVMRKDNVELDMSGRCSAGQKMLASIIIRLALAETFSVNCGVIALDEPTTNLDVQNMKNLATQLVKLVESRQSSHGKPFQLIVITHSTEFVKLLLQSGSFDHFYQITRGSDGTHHYSQIKKCAETVLLT